MEDRAEEPTGGVGCSRRARVWELFSGSAALSARASREGIPHLPPIDFRYGWDLGRVRDQTLVLRTLLEHGVETLFAAPNCAPWGSQTRGLPGDVFAAKRKSEEPSLVFLAVC